MRRRNEQGLTLIELMVAAVLVTLVSAGTYVLLTRAWQNQEALLVQSEVQRDARAACDLVCDAIRSIPRWDPAIAIAYSDAQYSYIGQSPGWDIHVAYGAPCCLVRVTPAYSEPAVNGTVLASVSNVTSFKLVFTPMDVANGAVSQSAQPVWLTNLPDVGPPLDPNLTHMVAATVTVTASKTSMYGITYTSTVSSTVKIRAQTYTLAPP